MANNILVSVCMITYNHSEFIKQAIEGILMQKCNFEVELIIADDLSPDNTKEIVTSIINEHKNGSWIKYTRHPVNKGMMDNFEWVLSQAEGKYIALCEGDDYWTDPFKLQKQVDFMEENEDCSMCSHSYITHFMDRSQSDFITDFNISGISRISSESIMSGEYLRTCTLLVKSSVFINYPNWVSKSPIGGRPLLLISATHGDAGFIGGEPMSVYRRGVEGAWSDDLGNRNKWLKKQMTDQIKSVDLFNENTYYKYNKLILKSKRRWMLHYVNSLEEKISIKDLISLFRKNNVNILLFDKNKNELVFWLKFFIGRRGFNTMRRVKGKFKSAN